MPHKGKGGVIDKSSIRLVAYGIFDELNSFTQSYNVILYYGNKGIGKSTLFQMFNDLAGE